MVRDLIKRLILLIPPVRDMYQDLLKYKKGYPPGHYYSPIVSTEEVILQKEELFHVRRNIPGINLQEHNQLLLLEELKSYYPTIPYMISGKGNLRYHFENHIFENSDAIFLNSMIRHFCPKRIIEIGSGYSSAVMLDTNELFFQNSIELTFIEPYTERLKGLLRPGDYSSIRLIEDKLQNVSLDLFESLEENDLLFIDSTHVSKTGSDVNLIIFQILPRLKEGVIIHFHDIFYPFEYPKEWVINWSGFGWNEIYVLKAFLTHNNYYEIICFNTYLEQFHTEWFIKHMPECLKNTGGSLYLKKIKI